MDRKVWMGSLCDTQNEGEGYGNKESSKVLMEVFYEGTTVVGGWVASRTRDALHAWVD